MPGGPLQMEMVPALNDPRQDSKEAPPCRVRVSWILV